MRMVRIVFEVLLRNSDSFVGEQVVLDTALLLRGSDVRLSDLGC